MCLADPSSHGLLSSANTATGTGKILAYGKSAEMESKLEILSPACIRCNFPSYRERGHIPIQSGFGECIGDLAPMQNHQLSSSELTYF